MFTGIVETVGIIREATGRTLEVYVPVSQHIGLGDSLCVNGACLTVARRYDDTFGFDVMPETVRRTSFATLKSGDRVNVETALTLNKLLGGHFVQGHVDGIGQITEITPDGDAKLVDIACSPELLHYIVEKGFIAVDGASLTVAQVGDHRFRVSLVRYTLEHTRFEDWKPGDVVNLEVDILAKYTERLLMHAEHRTTLEQSSWNLISHVETHDRKEGIL